MELLLAVCGVVNITQEAVDCAAGNNEAMKDMILLLVRRSTQIQVTNKTVARALKLDYMPGGPKEVLQFLLRHSGKIIVSPETFIAAIYNTYYPGRLISFLFDTLPQVEITETVLQAATKATTHSLEMGLRYDKNVPITPILNAVAGNCFHKKLTIDLLLSRRGTADLIAEPTLRTAASCGNVNFFQALSQTNGLVIDISLWQQVVDLRLAAQGGDVDIISHLVLPKVEVDIPDSTGRTPLSLAAEMGHGERVRILVVAGADPKSTGQEGWTPLFGAVSEGHRDIVKILMDGGANIDVEDIKGKTPLGVAKKWQCPNMLAILSGKGRRYDSTKDALSVHLASRGFHPQRPSSSQGAHRPPLEKPKFESKSK